MSFIWLPVTITSRRDSERMIKPSVNICTLVTSDGFLLIRNCGYLSHDMFSCVFKSSVRKERIQTSYLSYDDCFACSFQGLNYLTNTAATQFFSLQCSASPHLYRLRVGKHEWKTITPSGYRQYWQGKCKWIITMCLQRKHRSKESLRGEHLPAISVSLNEFPQRTFVVVPTSQHSALNVA